MSGDEKDAAGRAFDRRLMRRLLSFLRPHRGRVALAVVVALGDALVQLAGPYLTMEAIDHGIRHRDLGHLERVATLYLAVLLVGFGLSYLQTQIMQRVGQGIIRDLRQAMFRHLQRLPVSYLDRNPAGRVMARLTHDMDVLQELFTAGVIAIVGDLFTLVGILIAMMRLNAELLGVAFSVLPLIAIVTLTFRSRARRTFREVRARFARLNAVLTENLGGMSTVQLMNREGRNREQFRRVNAEHRDAHLQAVRQHALFYPLLELVGALAVSLIVWYGGRQVMWAGITLGTLVAFIQYTQRFFRPISDLGEKFGMLQQAMASSERIFDLLDTPPDPGLAVAPSGRPAPIERLAGRLELDGVWFAYRGQDWVLEDIRLSVAPGERVALVGASGSGKSTLASLLVGFYMPQRGAIRVDGRDLREIDARSLRRRLGLVLQDAFLFTGTIESNLGLARAPDGVPDVSPHDPGEPPQAAAIERAAREVHAHEFIARLPGAYRAEVRERGASFSMGQRQLLAFARALVADPDVLILDEATSSVDTHTEALIQRALRRLMRGRTCLVIAHRLSTLQDVDRIVVLHHGRIRETGTHAELVERRGIYYRLHQLQCLGGPPAARPAREPRVEPIPDELPALDVQADLA